MNDLLSEFLRRNALLKGHFKLASGLHSDTYFQCARLYEDPGFFKQICSELVRSLDSNFDKVIACAVGGIVPAYEIAFQMGKKMAYLERINGRLEIRRGFAISKDESFLVVEDVVTTGGTVEEIFDFIENSGGVVKGVASLILRAKASPFENLKYLLKISTVEVNPDDCQLCKTGVPVSIPGVKALQA
ncbi:MAG: orotate phosphoribosyltransferase [Planctomycetes bacterium]|nr:orotate phosphoribosyltransferase [Planctomycetota bacterium]